MKKIPNSWLRLSTSCATCTASDRAVTTFLRESLSAACDPSVIRQESDGTQHRVEPNPRLQRESWISKQDVF